MQTRRLCSLLLALALLMGSSPAASASIQLRESEILAAPSGETYYVSNGGDDDNLGTESAPWAYCPGMPGWSGSATLQPGDVVYFDSAGTWTASSGASVLQVIGGVTYDGSTWGDGTRATLRAMGYLSRSVVNLMEDDPSEPTIIRGFEVDANGYETTGIGINWPQAQGNMTGATKRIEDCVVHDVYSHAPTSYEYGIVISSGWGGNLHVSNVEVLDCAVYNISRGGVNVYAANDYPNSSISNVLVRGCDIYATGQDPSYAGSALAAKNHVIDVVLEYNTVRDPERGPGIGVSTHPEPGFIGPENLVIRHNIVLNSPHTGMYVQDHGDKSMEIYGNLIANSAYEGVVFSGSLADSLSVRLYNNTFYQNYEPEWGSEIRVHTNSATITTFEVRNNIFYADSNSRCLIDDEGNITNHSNNVYYRPSSDTLVIANGTSYTAGTVGSWEPTALTGDPLFANPSNLPSGFIGTFGVDIRPNSDGLNLTENSPAKDAGASLGAAYNSSINSVTRPNGAGWDIGAYEFQLGLTLYGIPGNQAIYLNWDVNGSLPVTSTWHIDYYTTTASILYITGLPSATRDYPLNSLQNYQWYTVTLSAMVDSTPILSDTVRVMPTDRIVYLPLALR